MADFDACVTNAQMKMSRLMEHHRKFEREGLTGNLGDGYLMANNRVFRVVRDAALAIGYRFSSERDEAYETFPLLQLDEVLAKKTFPYSNNVVALANLSAASLEALNWDDIDGNLKKNFVFHEACHGLVRSIALKTLGPAHPVNAKDLTGQQRVALRMLLEESCANTCELLGVAEVGDQVHRLFYEMNSYVCEFENRTNLKNAINEIGSEVVTKFMVLSYLQANFLRDSFGDGEFREMLAIAADGKILDPRAVKTLRALGKIAFNLSERFRKQTTSFHLRLAGISTHVGELFNFDFLAPFKNDPAFKKFLNEFAAVFK